MPCCRKKPERMRSILGSKNETNAKKEEEPCEEPPPELPKRETEGEFTPPPLEEGRMPTFFHVGLLAKMCLFHGYNNGVWKLRTISKTENDFYLSTFGEGYPHLTSVYGGVEAYQEVGDLHASLGWLTTNSLFSNFGARGENLGGIWQSVMMLGLTTSEKCEFRAKLRCVFERRPIMMEMEVPIYRDPFLKAYLMVAPVENFVLGYRTLFNLMDKKFDMHAFCLGYDNQSTEVALKLENFNQLRGSIFHRFGEKWALGLKATIYGDVEAKNFTIGGQFEPLEGTLLKAKIRGDARVGLVYQRQLSEEIDVLFNLGFDAKDPLHGNIRLGASWLFSF